MARSRLLVCVALCALCAHGLACTTTDDGKSKQRRVVPDEPWRQARPPAGPVPELTLPTTQRVELKNGLDLIVVEDHALPVLSARVVVRVGSAQDGKDPGLAALGWELIDEGAGALNQLALANAIAGLGAELSTACSLESGAAQLEVASGKAEAGLRLLASVVSRPTFATPDVERARDRALAGLAERHADAGMVADALASALIYGSEHGYGHDGAGTADALAKVSSLKLKTFWSTYAAPHNAALIIAGDITLEQAKALANKTFGLWSGGGRAPKAPPEPAPRSAITIASVDFPGAAHTALRVGRAGLASSDADLPALMVLNGVLGGLRSSRLASKLREEKQWASSVQLTQAEALGRGPWLLRAEVDTTAVGDVVAETLAQLEAIKGGVTDEELARAKDGWLQALPGRHAPPREWVRALDAAYSQGFDPEMLAKMAEAVRAVT
ncbi:MAG: insulinase family protein, partial [Deltaproteobacteria bacterium]|nr:insulinase family protein [Deltaproteobacteria bacterium]